MAVLLALPIALLATRSLTPWPRLYYPVRWFLNALRGIDSFVFALLFVAASRLPGGVAATVMSVQPLVVGLLGVGAVRLALIAGASLVALSPAAAQQALAQAQAYFDAIIGTENGATLAKSLDPQSQTVTHG